MCQSVAPVAFLASDADASAWSRYPDCPSKTYEYAPSPPNRRVRFSKPALGNTVIGSSNVYELKSPIARTSGLPLPVGSPASQSTSARAALVRVTLQLPWPSPVSGSPMSSHADPFDLRWFTATVTRSRLLVSSNVCASTGRLRVSMKRGSSAEVRSLYEP